MYFLIESGLALFLAFLINVAVVSVSGSVCSNPNISPENKAQCKNITLESAASLLKVLHIYIYAFFLMLITYSKKKKNH